jgi:hypothetical protein
MDPFKLLKTAIEAVPAVKYALGVAGIAAVVAIILGFHLNSQVAVFGTLIVIGLMFVLVVFSNLSQRPDNNLHGPATVLVWFYTVTVMASTVLFITSYFWGLPVNLASNHEDQLGSGSVTLYDGFKNPDASAFDFSSEQITRWGNPADVGVANPSGGVNKAEFFLTNDYPPYTDPNAKQHDVLNAGIRDMHTERLEDVREAPITDYARHYFPPIVRHVYCVRTRDGHHFAKIKITGVEVDRISFDYVYQRKQSARFER